MRAARSRAVLGVSAVAEGDSAHCTRGDGDCGCGCGGGGGGGAGRGYSTIAYLSSSQLPGRHERTATASRTTCGGRTRPRQYGARTRSLAGLAALGGSTLAGRRRAEQRSAGWARAERVAAAAAAAATGVVEQALQPGGRIMLARACWGTCPTRPARTRPNVAARGASRLA
jgi:hypothetical protein